MPVEGFLLRLLMLVTGGCETAEEDDEDEDDCRDRSRLRLRPRFFFVIQRCLKLKKDDGAAAAVEEDETKLLMFYRYGSQREGRKWRKKSAGKLRKNERNED